jgi:hypothetical protein
VFDLLIVVDSFLFFAFSILVPRFSLVVSPLSKIGMFDEDEVSALQKLQEIHEKKSISLEESHN